jgi:hypothetical protein
MFDHFSLCHNKSLIQECHKKEEQVDGICNQSSSNIEKQSNENSYNTVASNFWQHMSHNVGFMN